MGLVRITYSIPTEEKIPTFFLPLENNRSKQRQEFETKIPNGTKSFSDPMGHKGYVHIFRKKKSSHVMSVI